MYIYEEFNLNLPFCDSLRKKQPLFGFNGFGEIVYYRTYSRVIRDDFDQPLGQEGWADTVIRNINGVMSIRKDWYKRNNIAWDERRWQAYGERMAESMFRMEWLPPGRGLWAMGTPLLAERGAMALYNCAFSEIGDDWVDDICWMMDSLMYGVGVGFRPVRTDLRLTTPAPESFVYTIPDTREGWVESVRLLLTAFAEGVRSPHFDYSLIRPFGAPIKTFGGEASGPEPLIKLHKTITHLCYRFVDEEAYDEVAFKTDLANLVGVCVVAGNVRRSAEIGLASIDDPVFQELKDYSKHPYRAEWGWMSNNSALLERPEHFHHFDEIAQANIQGHDVGYLNMINIRQGRIGKNDPTAQDHATGINPCGEIPLEHREVCNLAETLPTRCSDVTRWLEACEYATFYTSTVTLLPTHQASTNKVILRNRRIGVSIIDFTGWKEDIGIAGVISALRRGYERVRQTNRILAEEAGIPESIRVTTVKPGGTIPKVAGKTSGAGYPTFEYTLRRINVGVGTPIDKVLLAANVPYEDSVYTPNTHVFEYPIHQGPARPATQVTLWEQAMNIVLLQREWADNAVSNTLYFKPKWSRVLAEYAFDEDTKTHIFKKNSRWMVEMEDDETQSYGYDEWKDVKFERRGTDLYRFNPNHEEDQIEDVLAHIAPLTKSVSLLPHSDVGIFAQMPEEGITKEEYERRLAEIKPIDWTHFEGSDGMDEKFCVGDHCTIPGAAT